MKRIVTIITAALFLAACSSTNISDEESKRKELKEYKIQLSELEAKIRALEGELESTNDEEQAVKVSVTELGTQLFEHFIEVTGKVEADLDVNVSPESVGVIDSILVVEGQRVSKNQPLGKLNTDALERNLEELKIQLSLAETNFQRQKNLWDQNIGSEMQFLEARTNMESLEKRIDGIKAQIKMAQITSPVDGVVDIVHQKEGEIGGPQIPFAKVLNISNIKIYADVSESYLTKVKKGEKVNIYFPALNRELEAPISQIGNTIDPNNRTFRIRIDLRNPDGMIKPNLVSVIQIRDYVSENALVIPSLFIKQDFNGSYIFVAENSSGSQRAAKVYVEPGMTNNNRTEITGGLETGMKIISEGYSQISDGTPIQY
ncbi:MAG: efflux RND transporter periplasmic adaptor subunit [Mariniphaga sp.]|jgi:RND family efflux transporter MFP subunit|nr:efflux RND transporter periplasmic adaptor subunit [Mariniphaga sp.]